MKRALLAAVLLAATPLHAAEPAPRVSINNVALLPRPLPFPYPEERVAAGDVDGALGRARRRGVPLLLDLGGNWCPDCRILAAVLELPELKDFVARHFELLMVDVGRYNRNMDVPARWGLEKLNGVPQLLVIDAAAGGDGRLVNATTADALADARALSPQMIADFLARFAQ